MNSWYRRAQRLPHWLYHGSLGDLETEIYATGLRPGDESNRNWARSEPGYVYLIDSAKHAAKWVKSVYEDSSFRDFEWDTATAVIFRVDVHQLNPQHLEADPIQIPGAYRYRGAIPPSALAIMAREDWTQELLKSVAA